tara:strand:- start:130 stop:723 length:594 start_codon:yes stop_codon:yes gene_type:complete
MKCPKCSRENLAEGKFCSQCGAILSFTCPSCNKGIEEDSRFCTFCREEIQPTTTDQPIKDKQESLGWLDDEPSQTKTFEQTIEDDIKSVTEGSAAKQYQVPIGVKIFMGVVGFLLGNTLGILITGVLGVLFGVFPDRVLGAIYLICGIGLTIVLVKWIGNRSRKGIEAWWNTDTKILFWVATPFVIIIGAMLWFEFN